MNPSSRPSDFSFSRYLAAKRTVDDRALNHAVWTSLQHRLTTLPRPITVVEIGGGIGTMLERLLELPAIPPLRYHLLDAAVDNIAAAYRRLSPRPDIRIADGQDSVATGAAQHEVWLTTGDLFEHLPPAPNYLFASADLVIAHAFLDLIDIRATLPLLVQSLPEGALTYFTINFDGATIFQPTIDPALDAHIERLYHRTMDERITDGRPSGDSQAGRHLFHTMQEAGIQVLDAGSSDWVVIPHAGSYPADEAYFLHFIIHTLHGALSGHPELDAQRFDTWIATRHAQVERGELLYIAHQMDYLGVVSATIQNASPK
jgi:hypothetical protein